MQACRKDTVHFHPMKAERLLDASSVDIHYPVFVIADALDGFMAIAGPRARILPVFTNRDTAEQFIEDRPLPEQFVTEIPSRDLLRLVLKSAEAIGIGQVTLDPSTTRSDEAPTFPVRHILSILEVANRKSKT